MIIAPEECDDGNTTDGDGCSASCQSEDGWTCAGQPSVCAPTCGDGKVRGSEKCDLGPENGQLDSGCTSDCKLRGQCTTSRAGCTTAADCPAGQGCCGNGTTEVSEECDDGNLIDLDCCSQLCKTEPAGTCEPQACNVFGPHLVPAFVKRATMTDRDHNGVSERWNTRGDFNMNAGQKVDPDAETVELIFSQGGTKLYGAMLAPSGCSPLASCFVQKGPDICTKSWKFSDKEADIATAIGWKTGKLTQRKLAGVCGNKIAFNLRSGKNATMTAPTPTRLRQSIRIGDDCATALLTCTATRTGLKCASTSP